MNDLTVMPKPTVERWLRFCLCALLVALAGYLGKSAWDASWANLQRVPPNRTAELWSNVDSLGMLASLASAIIILIRRMASIYFAIVVSVVGCSIYASQLLLQIVNRASDQTYLLTNPYLAKPVLVPLAVSLISLAVGLARLAVPGSVAAPSSEKL